MEYQIIAKWNENQGTHHLRIEPQEYWCNVMGGEETWDSNLLEEKAKNKLREYQK